MIRWTRKRLSQHVVHANVDDGQTERSNHTDRTHLDDLAADEIDRIVFVEDTRSLMRCISNIVGRGSTRDASATDAARDQQHLKTRSVSTSDWEAAARNS